MEEQFKTIKGKERGELKKKIDALKAKKKSIPLIRALWDRGESSPTYESAESGQSRSAGERCLARCVFGKALKPAAVVGANKTGNRWRWHSGLPVQSIRSPRAFG